MKINVNLKPCNLSCVEAVSSRFAVGPTGHHPACNATPVLIPLPLQPFRSVTFEVVLGECIGCERGRTDGQHFSNCPARPVRVACSISGKTWEESKVVDCERADGGPLPEQSVVDERWALVKALVLGRDEEWRKDPKSEGWNLQPQRDAVYAALAERTKAEDAADAQDRSLHKLLPHAGPYQPLPSETRPSAAWLAQYTRHLIEQVGTLS